MSTQPNDVFSFSYFGKLSQYADFIKYKSGVEGFTFLDEWLQNGIASAKLKFKNEWKEIYHRTNTIDFFFPVKKNNTVLAGVLFPGKDKSGREFPFIVFAAFPVKSFDINKISSLPLQLNRVYYSAKQLLRLVQESTDLNYTNTQFGESTARLIPVSTAENIFNEYLDSTSLQEFSGRIYPGNFNSSKNISDKNNSVTISFNSDDENYNFDIGFFLLLSKIFNQKKDSLPFIFKSTTNDYKVNLFISYEQPETDDFSKIISGETTNDILSLLLNTDNQNISLKQFIDEQRLHSH